MREYATHAVLQTAAVSAPLPPVIGRLLVAAALLAVGGAAIATVARPALRQGRLLDAANHACLERIEEAQAWLDREPDVTASLQREQRASADRRMHLLTADDEVVVRSTLEQLAEASGLEASSFRLGTPRHGEAFDVVPAALTVEGDRVELPPFLEAFYRQPRVVRLVSLDVESPEYGTERAVATLRWEFASPARARAEAPDPSLRWAPPSLAVPSAEAAVAGWNTGKWDSLTDSAAMLRGLGPQLRRVAGLNLERETLETERRALERWQAASTAERGAVLRKIPALLQTLDASAIGRAGLRPGPGGTLQIVDDD